MAGAAARRRLLVGNIAPVQHACSAPPRAVRAAPACSAPACSAPACSSCSARVQQRAAPSQRPRPGRRQPISARCAVRATVRSHTSVPLAPPTGFRGSGGVRSSTEPTDAR